MTLDRFLLRINHVIQFVCSSCVLCVSSRECWCGNRYDYDRHGLKSVCPSGKYKGEGDPVINDKPNCENECHCEDELPCFFTNGTCKDGYCGVEKGGCQYRCTEDKRDEWCSCDEGFDISPNDWRKCIDINECAGERGGYYDEDCHTCVNTIGSYTCECDDGYELDSATNQTCF
ncbi:hypothetical protein CAPTEDRAFT_216275, partial [Capitella teleta]